MYELCVPRLAPAPAVSLPKGSGRSDFDTTKTQWRAVTRTALRCRADRRDYVIFSVFFFFCVSRFVRRSLRHRHRSNAARFFSSAQRRRPRVRRAGRVGTSLVLYAPTRYHAPGACEAVRSSARAAKITRTPM